MKPIEAPINGSNYMGVQPAPESALQQFYAAFNGRDLELMSENWAQTDEISLDNPLGGIRRGWAEIRLLYVSLFCGPASVYVAFYDYTRHVGQALFYAAGRERGYFCLGDTGLVLAIRTSRIFNKVEGKGARCITTAPSTILNCWPATSRQ